MDRRDLSHPLETGMPVYPGTPPVSVEPRATIEDVGARITHLDIGSHTGTHVDAPSHILPDGPTLDAYDLSSFVFETRLIDCQEMGAREPITREDLPAVEAGVDLLVFRTGWDAHWGTDRYRDHPYVDADVGEWCADRGYAVGIDAFSPDPTPSVDPQRHGDDEPPDGEYPVHDAVLGADLRIVENLTNLDGLPERFTLEAYPLSIPGGDGSPVRAVALVE